MKSHNYSTVKYTPKVPLILLIVEKIACENFNFVLLLSFFLVLSLMHNCKVYDVNELSAHQTTALLSEIIIFFWVGTVCKIQCVSYGSKHASQPLSDMTLVHTYTRNSKNTGCIWTFYTSNDCSTIGDVHFLC